MGILNITPDSFYVASRLTDPVQILKQAEAMLTEGADFLDIGGYSSRPGATDISESEELNRVVPVVSMLKKEFPTCIVSVDTFRSTVAKAALDIGADMINDISGGEQDSAMLEIVARFQIPYILMHMRGTPQTMNQLTDYENVVKEIIDHFHQKLERLKQAGVSDVIIDPGFGFSKTASQSFEVLKHLELFKMLEKPLLVGISRKSMIWRTLKTTPELALNGTSVLNTIALRNGASILRVHDVRAAREAITLLAQL